MSPPARPVSFPGGTAACIVETAPVLDAAALLERLDVPTPCGTVVVNGSTTALSAGTDEAADVLAAGVAGVAVPDRLTVVTGATDAGIFSRLGAALAAATAPVIGVAPLGLVRWPGGPDGPGREPLEGHHSHFVLVEGSEWGGETGTMLALVAALGRQAPTAAVVFGGGQGARLEVLGHVRAGRPIVVLSGSGRLADDLAAAAAGESPPGDSALGQIVAQGHLVVCPLAAGPDVLAATLREALAGRR